LSIVKKRTGRAGSESGTPHARQKQAADQARALNERPIRLVALLGVDATPGTHSIPPSGQVFKVKSLESATDGPIA
jgi:hypothetical protein